MGIVGDTQQRSGWGSGGPLAPAPLAFIPVSQTTAGFLQMAHTWFSPNWIVRASVPAHGVIAGMERAVHAVDPELPFAGFRSLEQVRAESLGLQRFLMVLLAAMAGLAMVLAAVGMYGLIAASVAERTRELGIRMALGATARQAAAAVAAPGLALALTGISAGAVLARAVAGVLRHLVWGVSTSDPATFAFVAAALLAAAAMAVLFPALRVLRLDPARILRDE